MVVGVGAIFHRTPHPVTPAQQASVPAAHTVGGGGTVGTTTGGTGETGGDVTPPFTHAHNLLLK